MRHMTPVLVALLFVCLGITGIAMADEVGWDPFFGDLPGDPCSCRICTFSSLADGTWIPTTGEIIYGTSARSNTVIDTSTRTMPIWLEDMISERTTEPTRAFRPARVR